MGCCGAKFQNTAGEENLRPTDLANLQTEKRKSVGSNTGDSEKHSPLTPTRRFLFVVFPQPETVDPGAEGFDGTDTAEGGKEQFYNSEDVHSTPSAGLIDDSVSLQPHAIWIEGPQGMNPLQPSHELSSVLPPPLTSTYSQVSFFESANNNVEGQVVEVTQVIYGVDQQDRHNLNEYAIVGDLGRGSYGIVKLAMNTTTNQLVAIKVLPKPIKPESSRAREIFAEVEVMKTRRHPNLVKLIAVMNDKNYQELYLVMEYVPGGAMGKTENTNLTPHPISLDKLPELRHQFADIIHGLQYLHEHNVAHMDVKLENILIDQEGGCKVVDFGLSQILSSQSEQLKKARGTPFYFSPEMQRGQGFHGFASDVWALGITLFIRALGCAPFNHPRLVIHTAIDFMEEQVQTLYTGAPGLLNVMQHMLCRDPSKRITIQEAARHPFFCDRVPLAWYLKEWKAENKRKHKEGKK
eukprot:PhF_6_TR40401/c0_g1_i1/m.60196/K07359/CAMKK2; calcium/calmodulin-dependent protein kinase kinase 2